MSKKDKKSKKEKKLSKATKKHTCHDHAPKPVTTEKAPAALGPYSQAMKSCHFVFASGQLGIDPTSGRLPESTTAQTTQAIANLQAVLEEAGSSLDNVVKTTCFMTNLGMFDAFNAEYAKHFSHAPARECVQVAALPKGAAVEISAIAII